MNRKQGPPGTSWCSGHKKFLPVSAFTRDSSRWNGLDSVCAECRSKRRKSGVKPRKPPSMKKPRKSKKGSTSAAKKIQRRY